MFINHLNNWIEDILFHLQATVVQEALQVCCRTELVFNIYNELDKWPEKNRTQFNSNMCMDRRSCTKFKLGTSGLHESTGPSAVKNDKCSITRTCRQEYYLQDVQNHSTKLLRRPWLHGWLFGTRLRESSEPTGERQEQSNKSDQQPWKS